MFWINMTNRTFKPNIKIIGISTSQTENGRGVMVASATERAICVSRDRIISYFFLRSLTNGFPNFANTLQALKNIFQNLLAPILNLLGFELQFL